LNAYDRLAQEMRPSSDTAATVAMYEKSLHLAPGNTNTTTTLQRIRSTGPTKLRRLQAYCGCCLPTDHALARYSPIAQ
jgi:hypothetical protein